MTIEKQEKIIVKENTKTEDSRREKESNKINPQTGENKGSEISFKYTQRLCEYACGGSTRSKQQ